MEDLPLTKFLPMSQKIIIDLEEVKEEQKQQIIKLCQEKEALEEERKILEDICLALKKKTRGVFGKMGDRDFELGKMIKKAKEFSTTMNFGIRAAAGCSRWSDSSPPDKNKMTEAQDTIERQELKVSSLQEKLRDPQKMVKDHEAAKTTTQQTIERQGLEISSRKESPPDCMRLDEDQQSSSSMHFDKNHGAEGCSRWLDSSMTFLTPPDKNKMTEAQSTIKRQELEISSLQEKCRHLLKMVKNQEEEMTTAQQTIERQGLEISRWKESPPDCMRLHEDQQSSHNMHFERNHEAEGCSRSDSSTSEISSRKESPPDCMSLHEDQQSSNNMHMERNHAAECCSWWSDSSTSEISSRKESLPDCMSLHEDQQSSNNMHFERNHASEGCSRWSDSTSEISSRKESPPDCMSLHEDQQSSSNMHMERNHAAEGCSWWSDSCKLEISSQKESLHDCMTLHQEFGVEMMEMYNIKLEAIMKTRKSGCLSLKDNLSKSRSLLTNNTAELLQDEANRKKESDALNQMLLIETGENDLSESGSLLTNNTDELLQVETNLKNKCDAPNRTLLIETGENDLSESRGLLANIKAELLQVKTNWKNECDVLNRMLQIEREDNQFLRISLMAKEKNIQNLKEDQQLLEDMCLQMKKRNLGFFGRRMEDRDTELTKLRRKMTNNETDTRFFPRVIHRMRHHNSSSDLLTPTMYGLQR